MELRHIRYFLAVAEELSFSRAALRLHIAQPSLSVQVKDLEAELGVLLFDRTRRNVHLTHAGAAFAVEARTVLAAVQHAEQQARRAEQGMIGTFRIGVIAPAANAYLARRLRAYRNAFPLVNLSLHEQASNSQIDQLLAEQIDVGFLRPPMDHPDLDALFLSEAPMALAVFAGHRFATARQVEWKDFDEEPLVMVQPALQHGYYDKFLSLCSDAGARPTVGQYANDVQTVLWMVSAGLGIAPTTKTLAEIRRPGLVFCDLPLGRPMVQTLLVWRRADKSPLLREFLSHFEEGSPSGA